MQFQFGIFVLAEGMDMDMAGRSCVAVLVLVCGLPAAGKTTLVKQLVARSNTRSRLYERISFDDLFEEVAAQDATRKPTDFDPAKWKLCQQEMVVRVGKRLEMPMATDAAQQLVLLVDDNFQYRSLRKRFYHLAAELNCGYAVLYMDVPAEICRERNAGRSGVAQVPVEVFDRMLNAFEAPDGQQNAWEVNSHEFNDADNGADIDEVMDTLLLQAGQELQDRWLLQVEKQKEEAQQRRDRLTTQQNVLHLVDLQLRQWISAQLRDERSLPPGMTKAKLASQLNQRRKEYLGSIRTGSHGLVQGESIDRAAVSLVRRFQQK